MLNNPKEGEKLQPCEVAEELRMPCKDVQADVERGMPLDDWLALLTWRWTARGFKTAPTTRENRLLAAAQAAALAREAAREAQDHPSPCARIGALMAANVAEWLRADVITIRPERRTRRARRFV